MWKEVSEKQKMRVRFPSRELFFRCNFRRHYAIKIIHYLLDKEKKRISSEIFARVKKRDASVYTNLNSYDSAQFCLEDFFVNTLSETKHERKY